MADFVSEEIVPVRGTFDPGPMAQGLPGMPSGFTWRRQTYDVRAVIESWKQSAAWDHHRGERYLRRHCYRLAMGDGAVWEVYFIRTSGRGGRANRWYLLGVTGPGEGATGECQVSQT